MLSEGFEEPDDIEEEHWSAVVSPMLDDLTSAFMGVVEVEDEGVKREKLSALASNEERWKVSMPPLLLFPRPFC